jgi:hypothetical protein
MRETLSPGPSPRERGDLLKVILGKKQWFWLVIMA